MKGFSNFNIFKHNQVIKGIHSHSPLTFQTTNMNELPGMFIYKKKTDEDIYCESENLTHLNGFGQLIGINTVQQHGVLHRLHLLEHVLLQRGGEVTATAIVVAVHVQRVRRFILVVQVQLGTE